MDDVAVRSYRQMDSRMALGFADQTPPSSPCAASPLEYHEQQIEDDA